MPLSPLQRRLVLTSWAYIIHRSLEVDLLVEYFTIFFARAPREAQSMFHADMSMLIRKFGAMIAFLIRNIDMDERIQDGISSLARRHAAYGVKVEYLQHVYPAMREALGALFAKHPPQQASHKNKRAQALLKTLEQCQDGIDDMIEAWCVLFRDILGIFSAALDRFEREGQGQGQQQHLPAASSTSTVPTSAPASPSTATASQSSSSILSASDRIIIQEHWKAIKRQDEEFCAKYPGRNIIFHVLELCLLKHPELFESIFGDTPSHVEGNSEESGSSDEDEEPKFGRRQIELSDRAFRFVDNMLYSIFEDQQNHIDPEIARSLREAMRGQKWTKEHFVALHGCVMDILQINLESQFSSLSREAWSHLFWGVVNEAKLMSSSQVDQSEKASRRHRAAAAANEAAADEEDPSWYSYITRMKCSVMQCTYAALYCLDKMLLMGFVGCSNQCV